MRVVILASPMLISKAVSPMIGIRVPFAAYSSWVDVSNRIPGSKDSPITDVSQPESSRTDKRRPQTVTPRYTSALCSFFGYHLNIRLRRFLKQGFCTDCLWAVLSPVTRLKALSASIRVETFRLQLMALRSPWHGILAICRPNRCLVLLRSR